MSEAPYDHINHALKQYEPGWYVWIPSTGQVGLVTDAWGSGGQTTGFITREGIAVYRSQAVGPRYKVQLGPDGPFTWRSPKSLRLANCDQVEYITGAKVRP